MTAATGSHLDLDALVLVDRPTARRTDEVTVLEAVAWWAGEAHSDDPACASPVVAAFVREWARALDDQDRQRLRAWVPKLAQSRDGQDQARGPVLADWLARQAVPAFLRAAGLHDHARRLEAHTPLLGWDPAVEARQAVEDADAAARVQLEAAWARSPGGSDAQTAAYQATRLAGLAAAGSALGVALGQAGYGEGLERLLALALRAALQHAPTGQLTDRVTARALSDVADGLRSVADAAALAAALRAPPDAAWLELRTPVRAADPDGLLGQLCGGDPV